MFRFIAALMCTATFKKSFCGAQCIKVAVSLRESPLAQVSPCHINFDSLLKPTDGPAESNHSSFMFPKTKQPRTVMTAHGFPAIYAASRVYVSINRFLDGPVCLTEDLLPVGLVSKALTGAGFSRNFLFLLFGRQVLRVRTQLLLRWLAGDLSPLVLDVRSFPEAVPAASRLVTAPCCDDTKWCANANSHLVVYSLEVRETVVNLLVSWDDGNTYRRQPVHVPPGSEPLLFAQYPSETYASLFFNHQGKGFVLRVLHSCPFLPERTAAEQRDGSGCRQSPIRISDRSIRAVTVQPTIRMLTVIVTEDNHLLISGRADTHFESASVMDAASLKMIGEEIPVQHPLRALATDGERWMLIDADQHVFLGSALDAWTSRVIRLRLENISDLVSPPPTLPQSSLSSENTSATDEVRFGSITAVASRRPYQVFLLRGRTIEVLSLTEPPADGSGGALSCSLRRVSLRRYLAPLDAQCGVLRLTAVSRSHLEPMVDKSDTLCLEVRLSVAVHLAVRPLVLFSSSALVSDAQLLESRALPDGVVTSRWLVTARSHPQQRQQPFLRQLQLAQLHVTSTATQAECPARLPHAFPVLVGCNPWLRLVARNKRVDADTCRQLKATDLRVISSPERDPLLRFQQRVRGERAVRLENGEWLVRWDDSWGCPLLSSDKAQFTPVLAVKRGDRLRPLRQATALYEIHGLHDFEFRLTAAAAGCRHYDRASGVSWRRAYAHLLEQHGNLSNDFDPSVVLNTATYVSCNDTTRLSSDLKLPAQAAENVSFELLGLPGLDNSILWVDSAKIHVFNFRVVDPLFTYCDLNLTVPVFFMHSSDVKEKTKLTILLVGVGLSLLAVLLAHVLQQVMRQLRRERKQQLDLLLTAADAFVSTVDAQQPPLIQELPPLDPARRGSLR